MIFLFILSGDTETQLGETDTYEEKKSCNRQNICSLLNSGWPVKVEVKGRLWDVASVQLHSTPICLSPTPALQHRRRSSWDTFFCYRGLINMLRIPAKRKLCGAVFVLLINRSNRTSDVSVWVWHPLWLMESSFRTKHQMTGSFLLTFFVLSSNYLDLLSRIKLNSETQNHHKCKWKHVLIYLTMPPQISKNTRCSLSKAMRSSVGH